MKPVFVLGVGAQKAGTSWLRYQLNQSEFADFGFRKEYHVWDVACLGRPLSRKLEATEDETPENALLRKMQTEPGRYEDYFRSLISNSIRITGDITPSYSMLEAEHFARIRERLKAAGFQVKVVFLMRDPVDRIWSMYRMRQKRAKRQNIEMSDDDVIAAFARGHTKPGVEERTRYDKTVMALRTAFDSTELYFDFYERLFEPVTLARLSDFLGVDQYNFETQKFVNVSNSFSLPDDLAKKCMSYNKVVYDFCHREFPETKTLWRNCP